LIEKSPINTSKYFITVKMAACYFIDATSITKRYLTSD
jgi:hypothetical protein